MEFVALGTLALFANKIIEEIKYIRSKDWNAAFTLMAVWLSGVCAMFVGAAAVLTRGIIPPGQALALGALDGWSKLLLGMTFTSTTSTLYDFRKAIDHGDNAKQPPLTSLP